MAYHSRATAKLLPGRISVADACYFLTWCTHHRAKTLTAPAVRATTYAAIVDLDESRDGTVLAATIMPDHVHLLLTLGPRLTVSQVVAKMKAAVTRRHPSLKLREGRFPHAEWLQEAARFAHTLPAGAD